MIFHATSNAAKSPSKPWLLITKKICPKIIEKCKDTQFDDCPSIKYCQIQILTTFCNQKRYFLVFRIFFIKYQRKMYFHCFSRWILQNWFHVIENHNIAKKLTFKDFKNDIRFQVQPLFVTKNCISFSTWYGVSNACLKFGKQTEIKG